MKVGIIAEGSYPYVQGGVSGWIQMLMENMPETEFEIIALSAENKGCFTRKYNLPENVTGVTNVFLTDQRNRQSLFKKMKLSNTDKEKLFSWLSFQTPDKRALPLLADNSLIPSDDVFFRSPEFWSFVTEHYEKYFSEVAFLEYLSMWRSLLSPIFTVLRNDFPDVDVIHAVSTGYAGLIGAYLKETQNIPFIITEHGMYAREREEEIIQSDYIPPAFKQKWIDFFYFLSKQAYDEADDVITLFESNSEFQKNAGAPERKLKVIPNGIDYESFISLPSKGTSEKLRIGSIIRVVPIKDIKTMIHAAYYLKKYEVPFEWTIVGPRGENPEYARQCEELIVSFNLEQEVFLVGEVDVRSFLPRFDVCVLSSISEGQPLAVLEGMAAGIPWITTNVGSCNELINGRKEDHFGAAGIVLPPVNPEALALKCKWMYEHPRERKEMGENGRLRVKAYYGLDRVIEKYTKLYEERNAVYGRNRVSS